MYQQAKAKVAVQVRWIVVPCSGCVCGACCPAPSQCQHHHQSQFKPWRQSLVLLSRRWHPAHCLRWSAAAASAMAQVLLGRLRRQQQQLVQSIRSLVQPFQHSPRLLP